MDVVGPMIRGLIVTLKSLGIGFALKEIFRCSLGISYSCNGIKIDSRDLFKFMMKVASCGFYACRSNGEIMAKSKLTLEIMIFYLCCLSI